MREFQALYADLVPVVDPVDVDRDTVRRLILVDTVHANRLGDLGELCDRRRRPGRGLRSPRARRRTACVHRRRQPGELRDGSLVTLLVHIIAERGIAVTPFEATVFALGIHEDTGSLTFSTTTPRDAEALAFCMRARRRHRAAREVAAPTP